MQRPDLPSRIAHALRPDARERQARELCKIRALLIASSAGHLLTRLNELEHAERMLREVSAGPAEQDAQP